MKGLHRYANRFDDLLYKGTRWSVFICLFISIVNCSFAQTSKEFLQASSLANMGYDVRPLTIGDKVPDITFRNVLNYKRKTARLSDFKGKLVILDMWSVTCTSCIAAFPKMEQIQKQFGNRVQILLVNPHDSKYDSEAKIKSVLDKLKKRTGFYPSLPIPIHDSILNYYFPHNSVPHQVWINGEGKVAAIVGEADVTIENINEALSGNELSILPKDDWGFDTKLPLLVDGNGGDSDMFLYRSMFTKYRSGIGFGAGNRKNQNGEIVGVFILNVSLMDLIGRAYPDLMNGAAYSRMIFKVKNLEPFKKEFDNKYAYCYDLTIPPTSFRRLNIEKHLRDDLKRFFNLHVYSELIKIKCLVITGTDRLRQSQSVHKNAGLDLDSASIKKYIHNYSVRSVLNFLQHGFKQPIVNETSTNHNIDIDFPSNINLNDQDAVMEVLLEAGFNITEEIREIEVVVICDLDCD